MKKYLIAGICLIMLIVSVSCSNSEKQEILTLKKMKELSAKGENLSWGDFEKYESTDIGSGLLILAYPIDQEYTILIGGFNFEEKPLYIYLVNKNDEKIDIRYDDIDEFLNKAL